MAAGHAKCRSAVFWLEVFWLAFLVDYITATERYDVNKLNKPTTFGYEHLHVPVNTCWSDKSRAKRFLPCSVIYDQAKK